MKIKERFEKHVSNNVKERIRDHRLTPVVIMAVTTIVVAHTFNNKQTKVIIVNNYGSTDEK
jgi:hypothetical protein